MATLYNQYIYKNGAWMKIGTSSDSVTYTLSYSALTGLLTLTGSDGSTSTVTIESGSSDAITGITVNGTTVTVTDGVAAISIPTNVSAFTNDAGYITTPAFKITVTENNGTYTADKTYAEVESAINAGYICYISYEPYYYYYTMYLPGEGYYFEITSVASYRTYFCYTSDGTLFSASEPIIPSFSATSPIAVMGSSTVTYYLQDNYGDTKNPYASKTKNYVLAAPSTANGAPSFRALVASDIPDLSGTYLTSYTETDPVFSASAAAGITATDISNWNAKSNTDEKLKVEQASQGTYYPILSTDSNSASTKVFDTDISYNFGPALSSFSIGGTRLGRLIIKNGTTAGVRLQANGSLESIVAVNLPTTSGTLALTSDIPAQASINSTGLITYKNSGGSSLFTLQLPLYNGGVS